MDFVTLFSAINSDFSDNRRIKMQNIQKSMEEADLPQDAASLKKISARMARAEVKNAEAECLCNEVEAKYNLASAKAYSWVANHPGTVVAVITAATAAVAAYKNKKRTESAREEVNNLWNENAKLREELREKEMKKEDARMYHSFKRRCNRK